MSHYFLKCTHFFKRGGTLSPILRFLGGGGGGGNVPLFLKMYPLIQRWWDIVPNLKFLGKTLQSGFKVISNHRIMLYFYQMYNKNS